jgi:glycosyltransferase involved in cell wall biosynthesis
MTPKRRIILLHNYFSPYRVPLFRELARRFDLEVWLMGHVKGFRPWPESAGDEPFRCRVLRNVRVPIGNSDYQILLNYAFARDLAHTQADAIVGCGWDQPATLLAPHRAKRRGIPYILWSGSTSGEQSWRRSATIPLVRAVIRNSAAYIAYGTRASKYLVSLGADPNRVFRAYNAIEITEFAARSEDSKAVNTLKQMLGLEGTKVLLYCGQLIERKGIGDLIPAFAKANNSIPDLKLVIAGSGSQEAYLRQLSEMLGVAQHIQFKGFIPRTELSEFYSMADLLVLPSREEVWGLVLNEALACGTPVLTTTAVGASEDIVQDGVNGYVVQPASPPDLEGAIRKHFSKSIEEKQRMRAACKSLISPYSIEAMGDAFEQAISSTFE